MEPLAALSVATSIAQFVDFGSKLLSKYRKLYRSSNGVLSEAVDVEVITTDLMTLVQGLKRKLPESRPLTQAALANGDQYEDDEALDRLCIRCVEIGNELLKRLESIVAVKDKPQEGKRYDGQEGKDTGKQHENKEATAKLPEPTFSRRAGQPRKTQPIDYSSKEVEGPKSRIFKRWDAFRKAFRSVWDEKEIEALSATLHEFRAEIEFRILMSFRGALNGLASQQLHASHQLRRSTRLILDQFLNDRDQLAHQLRDQAEKLLEIQEGQARRETMYTQRIEDYFMGKLGPVGSLQPPRGPKVFDSCEVDGYTGDPRVEEEIRLLMVESGILESLSFVTLTDRRESLEVPYHQTFEWIYGEQGCPRVGQFSNFGDWLRQGSGIFWINGKVGSGKSTLMRYIYDNDKTRRGLEQWAGSMPSETYAFFFWNTGDDDQKSQRGLLRSLLFEILQGHRDLLSEVMPDAWDAWNFRASGVVSRRIPMNPCFLSQEVYPWTMIRLKRALRVLLDILQQRVKICLLIDGLDEYDGDYLEVVDLVQEYARSPNIKLCLSSRPLLVFEQAFGQSPHLRLQDLTHGDISHYVQSRLHSHKYMVQISRQHPAAVTGLIDEIVSKARGVFLWVKLVVKSLLHGLCDYNRISDLKKRVDYLPGDLEALYSHILENMDPFYHEQASQIFQIVRAAQGISPGHLTLLNLSWADDEDETLAEADQIRPLTNHEISTRCRMMDARLKSVCAGLLESNDIRFSDITPDSKVVFLHRTVSDWLAKRELWGELVSRTSGTGFSPNLCRATALKFAKTYPVVLLARNPDNYTSIIKEIQESGGKALGITADATDPASLSSALETVKKELPGATAAAAIYNVNGGFARKPFLDVSVEELDASLSAAPRGLFVFAQKVLPSLLESVDKSTYPPTLLLTGATASVKGSSNFGTFAAGKFALRALGQSLAREFGPRGVHVAHIIVDGVIDIPRTREWVVNGGVEGGKLEPEAIGESYWNLHTQHRSAFTQEIDLRPFVEKF
ncbi:uncharacterized protein DNG_02300 [Cephalotrichum gorgonifer]|uniref:NACHT domain-containing protein n=1 Tax=Cephalotrichum gorgonifer TaxID=2041049 RepID=A0AAE8MSS5_9PEZI|nr:uncharacterized protein DNG_02300 [Cephalotrichum gorgonifer]